MKFLVTAALALGILGLTPATAQVSRETTVRERPDGTVVRRTVRERPNGTVVRRTVVRRSETRRSYYGRPQRRTVCSVKYRNGNRIRTCRTVVR